MPVWTSAMRRFNYSCSAIRARTTPTPCAQSWTSAHFYSSLANCVLQMLLAAEVLGLSSMYISDVASPYFSVMLKSLLGIPEPLQIYHLLPMGFAKRSHTIHHPRRALEEMVHYERYDRSKFRGEAELQDFMMKMSIRGKEYSF